MLLPVMCSQMSTCPLEWENQKLLDAVTTKRPVRTPESSHYPKQNQKQLTLSAFLNKSKQQNNEEAPTSTIVTEDIESEQLKIDNESSEETASDICVTSNSPDDESTVKTTSTHSCYLTAHEI